jgi:YD repeat-containing protein
MKTKKIVTAPVRRSPSSLSIAMALIFLPATIPASAQEVGIYQEQERLIKAPTAVLKSDVKLFGEKVNLYTGSLEFEHNDVELPGNNKLRVSVGRHITVGHRLPGGRPFGRWDLEIPHIHGTFSAQEGWVTGNGDTKRCSSFGAPRMVNGTNGSYWVATEFWGGTFLSIPGGGEQRMLSRATDYLTAPADSPSAYPLVTSEQWAFSCLPSLANDLSATKTAGEGFIAVAPDGTKYRFDWMVTYNDVTVTKGQQDPITPSTTEAPPAPTSEEASSDPSSPSTTKDPDDSSGTVTTLPTSPYNSLARSDVWLLPTTVTDRFGNTVTYQYDPNRPGNLIRIQSSDGRVINLTYGVAGLPHLLSSVNDGTRTWNYTYTQDGNADLDRVVLPDSSAWQLSGITSLLQNVAVKETNNCGNPLDALMVTATGGLTHPSGAKAQFTLTPTLHGRNLVPMPRCGTIRDLGATPSLFYTNSLTSKTISGAGIADMVWRYDYGPANNSWDTCGSACSGGVKQVTETDPLGHATRYTFGNVFAANEGKLQQVDEGWDGSSALRTVKTGYHAASAGPYPAQWGTTDRYMGDAGTNMLTMPVDRRETSQQGATFTWEATAFDTLARATVVNRSSSLGYSRAETTTYEDNKTKWVMGQVKQVTDNGTNKVVIQNTYNSTTATLMSVRKFGKLQQSMTYNTDGTLKTVTDEKNQATTFSIYKRGIAQQIDYPDGSFETALVNNLGKITSLSNEVNSTHIFGYDAMGRLASIGYPSADTVAWNQTTLSLGPVGTQEYDIGAGHWKQTVTSGSATEVTYLDALWRPVYVERYDSADTANTSRIVKHQYDFEGRSTFDSYPQRSYGSIAGGIHNQYDALGRLTIRSTDSELGMLYEYYYYLDGFEKQYVDAKGYNTYYWYQAFDQPTEDAITHIAMPEGVAVDISRDIFGKTKSITRSGAGLSQMRSYVYDGYERLCKTIEPETGATVQDYDLANNVSWRATGLSLLSTSACDTASVAAAKKASFTYDTRNRLTGTTFGDGSAAINRTYTLDGLPETVSSNGTKWTYTYDKRGLLEGESLVYGSGTYAIGRTYDANGSLSQLRYPVDNLTVAYNPNALGEPRQVGSYATAITYYPNGALAGFTYGSGVRHTTAQNDRGLPKRATDGAVGSAAVDEVYTYDKNANVESITDQVVSGTASRSMTYDGLNRLKTTVAPNLWGTASYGYDTLDNLVSTSITAGQNARSTVHTIDYTTNRLASITNGPANFNFAYGYDAQGNIIKRGAQTYQFDLANRMTAAPGRATYVYDGLGRRVSVVGTDGVNRIQVYSQGGQLLYVAPSGSSGTKYIYLHNHQIAEVK